MSIVIMSTDNVDMEVDSNEVSIRDDVYDCAIDEGIDISRETTLKKQKEACLQLFERWSAADQTEFVEQLISRMGFHQHEHINTYLVPMLQRDFITALPSKYDNGVKLVIKRKFLTLRCFVILYFWCYKKKNIYYNILLVSLEQVIN